jgi:hypothetical protein
MTWPSALRRQRLLKRPPPPRESEAVAYWIQLAGLGLGLAGALVFALADAWLSRSLLTYLDALEANVERLVEAIRTRSTELAVTGSDLKRDRGQERARSLKTVAGLALALGFALQTAAAYLTKHPL